MTPAPLQLGQAPSELARTAPASRRWPSRTPCGSGPAVRCTSPGCSVASRGSCPGRPTPLRPRRDTEPWISEAQSSAHRFLHERADPGLLGGGQLLQREGGWPHGAFVEVRLVAEAERRVPRLELLRALEEADDLAVLGIRRHPVPGF